MDISHNKTNKCTNVKIIFYTQFIMNSDMFRSLLINLRELPKIIKTYIYNIINGLLNTLKFVHKSPRIL
jgi:hypothetical protein